MDTPSYLLLCNVSISGVWASGIHSGLRSAVDRTVSFWAEDIQHGVFCTAHYKMYHSFLLWPRRVQLVF